MASAPPLPASPTPATRQLRRWPASAGGRWAVRLGLALPLIALGAWAHYRGFDSGTHRLFVAQAEVVTEGGPQLAGIGVAYPPGPTLLAGVLPGGALGLSVVASLFAGLALHLAWEQLIRRGYPLPVQAGLVLPVFAVPAVAYLASQSVAGIAALSLLALALQGFGRFTVDRDTEAGFTTGLALAAAFAFDPIAVFYALALAGGAWFFARERFRTEPAAATATVAVIAFPTIFVVLAWMFLQWRFTGSAVHISATEPEFFTFPDGVLPGLGIAATTVGAALLHVPLFVAVALLYAARAPLALVGLLVAVVASVVAVWIGLRFTPVTAYVLFTLVALTSIPRGLGRRALAALAAVGAAQLALAWAWAPVSPGFADWLAAVLP
jgi:hypothetical protein